MSGRDRARMMTCKTVLCFANNRATYKAVLASPTGRLTKHVLASPTGRLCKIVLLADAFMIDKVCR